MTRMFRLVAFVAAAVCASLPARAMAQTRPTGDSGAVVVVASRPWVPVRLSTAAPLKRTITLDLDDVPVHEAIGAIARRGGLPIGYGKDVTSSKARVSLRGQDLTVAEALTAALRGTGLEAYVSLATGRVLVRGVPPEEALAATGTVVGRVTDAKTQTALTGATVVVDGTKHSGTTGSDGRYRIAAVAPGTYTLRARYIGYAPGTASVTVSADQEATADLGLEKSAQQLDEVVTTGTVVPTEVKALPTPISVITAKDIDAEHLERIDQIFRGDVPGGIAWAPIPDYPQATVITVRGASSLVDAPTIKTFVDGVEVADPGSLGTIDPSNIERIEVLRGPQASTLYGSGALNGVMQIFTKHGQLGLRRPEVSAKVTAGGIGGYDGQGSALKTDNSLSVLGGGEQGSYNLTGSYGHTGAWVPDYKLNSWNASAGAQTHQGPFRLSGSAQYSSRATDSPFDTRFAVFPLPFLDTPPNVVNLATQQTYGLTGTVQVSPAWQHTLSVGYDGGSSNFRQTQSQTADSLVYSNHIQFTALSLFYHTDATLRLGRGVELTATGGANYARYQNSGFFTFGATHTLGGLDGVTNASYNESTNTGFFGQAQLGVADRFFITAGVRGERNQNFGTDFGTSWSPRVGAAYSLQLGAATIKVRASFGQSIRPPTSFEQQAEVTPNQIHLANPLLAPERQRGPDGGVDVYVGGASLSATYYSQRAIDLIALITIPTPPGAVPTSQFQNISRVRNTGLELQGGLPLGPVQLKGTYSITNSTIQALPADFPSGGYQVGDRILGIPHTAAGATVTFAPTARSSIAVSMTHFSNWIETDILAEYRVLPPFNEPPRPNVRDYWVEYPAITKFGVSVSQVLSKGVTAFAHAENVGNNLRYERNNSIIPTPRSVLVGATLRY